MGFLRAILQLHGHVLTITALLKDYVTFRHALVEAAGPKGVDLPPRYGGICVLLKVIR